MRGKKKKSRVGTSQGGMRSLLGTRAGFLGESWAVVTGNSAPPRRAQRPAGDRRGSLVDYFYPSRCTTTVLSRRPQGGPSESLVDQESRRRGARGGGVRRTKLRTGAPGFGSVRRSMGSVGDWHIAIVTIRSSGRYPPAGLRHPPRCWRLAGQRSPLGAHRRHPAGPQRPCQVPVDRRPGELRGGRRMPPPGSSGPGRSYAGRGAVDPSGKDRRTGN